MPKVVLFSKSLNFIEEFHHRVKLETFVESTTAQEALEQASGSDTLIVADYDSVASEINKWIASSNIPKNLVVLENTPAIVTGKMLLSHGIKAYGNSKMLTHHFKQLMHNVLKGDIWSYPELTAALMRVGVQKSLSEDAQDLIDIRLSEKEKEVLYLVLEGLTNEAIANKLSITERTVKAHMSSIFNKLHVNDRLSLVLLLK